MATTFDAYETDFILDYELNKDGEAGANDVKKARWVTDFTHLFELVEQRVGKLNRETGYTITVPGSGSKLLKVVSTVTDVTKIESKSTDDGDFTEIATTKWVYTESDNTIKAKDTSEAFYFYDVINGNIRLTVDIGYETWDDFPTKLKGDIVNIARNYYQMLENVDSTVPDGAGTSIPNRTNFAILNEAFEKWLPYPFGGFVYVPGN